jgi:hypothetical protein
MWTSNALVKNGYVRKGTKVQLGGRRNDWLWCLLQPAHGEHINLLLRIFMEALETYQARYRRDVIYVVRSDRTQNEGGNCAFMLLCCSESGR